MQSFKSAYLIPGDLLLLLLLLASASWLLQCLQCLQWSCCFQGVWSLPVRLLHWEKGPLASWRKTPQQLIRRGAAGAAAGRRSSVTPRPCSLSRCSTKQSLRPPDLQHRLTVPPLPIADLENKSWLTLQEVHCS